MRKSTLSLHQLFAWAGIIGPVLFVAVFTLEGWLRPGYNPLEMYISALSLGTSGWIQMTNFIVLGVQLALFTWGVAAEFRTGKASRGGVILFAIMAVLFMVSGPFVMDPTGTPQSAATVHGTIHGLAGGIIFLLMPISIFVFLRRFRADPNWQSIQSWTLILGIIDATTDLFFIITSKAPQLQNTFMGWMGLIQRAALVPFMVWVLVFGVGLLRRNSRRGISTFA